MSGFAKYTCLFLRVTQPDLAKGTMVMPEIKRSLHGAMKYQQHLWPYSFLSFIKLFASQIVMWCGRNTASGHTQWKNSVILCARNNSAHWVLCIVMSTILLSPDCLACPPLGRAFTWYTRSPLCSSHTIVPLLQTTSKLQNDALKVLTGVLHAWAMKCTAVMSYGKIYTAWVFLMSTEILTRGNFHFSPASGQKMATMARNWAHLMLRSETP